MYMVSELRGEVVFHSFKELHQILYSSGVCPQSLQSDTQIGSPMVCSGGVLAGIALSHNPETVYTPISDYVTWIQSNQKTRDNPDNEWK
jgi:hypothetical protein